MKIFLFIPERSARKEKSYALCLSIRWTIIGDEQTGIAASGCLISEKTRVNRENQENRFFGARPER